MWQIAFCWLLVVFGTFIGESGSLLIGKHLVNESSLFDFNERLRLLLSDVISPSLTKTQQALDLYDFQMKAGYQSALHPFPNDASHVYGNELRVVYTCGEEFTQYSNVFLEGNKQKRVFHSLRLVQMLRHKQIAFVGDSLARQFFLDLSAELRPLQTFLQYGKLPEIFTLLTDNKFSLDDHTDLRYPTSEYTWKMSPFAQEDEIPLLQKDIFMRRYYAEYNTTLLWCEDPMLNKFQDYTFAASASASTSASTSNPSTASNSLTFAQQIAKIINNDKNNTMHPSHCDLSALLRSQFIIIGVGAWFKPFNEEETTSNTYQTKDYHQEIEQKARELNSAVYTYRSIIQKENPYAHIFWSLLPHIGFLEELKHPQTSLHAKYASQDALLQPHGAGKHWSNLTLGALYPLAYNHVLRNVAQSFRDEHLDLYKVSVYHLLTYIHGMPLPLSQENLSFNNLRFNDFIIHSNNHKLLHTDSIHYCPGSIYRSGLFVLQAAIEHCLEQQRRRERKIHQALHNNQHNDHNNVQNNYDVSSTNQVDDRPLSIRSVPVFDVPLSDMNDEKPLHIARK